MLHLMLSMLKILICLNNFMWEIVQSLSFSEKTKPEPMRSSNFSKIVLCTSLLWPGHSTMYDFTMNHMKDYLEISFLKLLKKQHSICLFLLCHIDLSQNQWSATFFLGNPWPVTFSEPLFSSPWNGNWNRFCMCI